MWSLRDKYAIAGIGNTRYSSNSGATVGQLAVEACRKAIEDAGLTVGDVDGIVSYNFGDSVPGMLVATALGMKEPGYVVDFASGGNAANLITLTATAAIEAGLAKNVLCFRAMNGRSGFRLGGGRDMNARGISQFTAPFGWITYPQAMAMWCRRHMNRYGTTSEQLGRVAVDIRAHAIDNPRAMMRTPLTLDDHQNSRMIVDPFRIYDICLETDGACAVLVTSTERARDLRRPPVLVSAGVYGGGPAQGDDLFDAMRWPDHSRNFLAHVGDELWRRAGLGPADVDIAEIYDCFTYSVLMALEGLGFCRPGEAAGFVEDGGIRRDGGRLPVNTHGGLLSEAYIHGLNHVCEAVEQLRGEAGSRQVEGARVAVTTAGAMTCGSALVLRAA
jgi:acetyl-CoA acetyltransferase